MRVKTICQLKYNAPNNVPFIMMLRPKSGIGQQIIEETFQLSPAINLTEYVDSFGNACQRFLSPIGDFQVESIVIAETNESVDVNFDAEIIPVENLPEETLIYLLPSRYCESDLFLSMAVEITQEYQTGYQKAEAIREWVYNNISYQYGFSNSSSTACSVNQSGVGVCRDFSHLGISLCRAINIPARMVVGYLYQLEPMDLHAWYEVYLENQWYTFDATQPEPKGNRLVLAHGRDASDVAFATHFGFVYLNEMQVSVELASIN